MQKWIRTNQLIFLDSRSRKQMITGRASWTGSHFGIADLRANEAAHIGLLYVPFKSGQAAVQPSESNAACSKTVWVAFSCLSGG